MCNKATFKVTLVAIYLPILVYTRCKEVDEEDKMGAKTFVWFNLNIVLKTCHYLKTMLFAPLVKLVC